MKQNYPFPFELVGLNSLRMVASARMHRIYFLASLCLLAPFVSACAGQELRAQNVAAQRRPVSPRAPVNPADTLAAECDARQARACEALGRAYEWGSSDLRIEQDTAQAVVYYVNACNLGSAASCFAAGINYASKPNPTTDDYGAAAGYFRRVCEVKGPGQGEACIELGVNLIRKNSGFVSDEASSALKQGCSLNPAACKKESKQVPQNATFPAPVVPFCHIQNDDLFFLVRIIEEYMGPRANESRGLTNRPLGGPTIYRMQCNLKTRKCLGVEFDIKDSISMFSLSHLEAEIVSSVGGSYTIRFGPYRTFIYDAGKKTVAFRYSSDGLQGGGQGSCERE